VSPIREAVLRELVALEVELRSAGGDRPALKEFLNRFPGDAAVVTAAFASWMDGRIDSNPFDGLSSSRTLEKTELFTKGPCAAETLVSESARPAEDREFPPRRLGRYQVVRLLGRGSFGYVYLARDDELDRYVAIKVPTARALASPRRLEALLSEARLAAGLRHPGIVGVYDVGRDEDGCAFIVLEFVEGYEEGPTLSDLLQRGKLNPVLAADLIASVADAVSHAHAARMVHRDV
jgi:hypothetical protein